MKGVSMFRHDKGGFRLEAVQSYNFMERPDAFGERRVSVFLPASNFVILYGADVDRFLTAIEHPLSSAPLEPTPREESET